MSEEEKEAIEYLKKYIKWETYGERSLESDIKTTLNLIDKLQKENKKYIDVFNSTEKIMNKQERTKDKLEKENEELKENSISKDIIRDKIKELKENENCNYCNNTCSKYFVCKVLKELLGE